MVRYWILFAAAFGWLFIGQSSFARQGVELELVLAIDTSTSVDEDEYLLQRNGVAAAIW